MPNLNYAQLTKVFARRLQAIGSIANDLGLNWGRGAVLCGLALTMIWVSYAIYYAVENAGKNYELLVAEQKKLADVRKTNEDLSHQAEYYASLEYKQRYAYDSLNLAREGERLYLIESRQREQYDLEKKNPDPVKSEDKRLWWELLIAEMWRRI